MRVTAPMSFGTMHLSALLPGFLLDHPEVAIELDLNDRTVDLMAEGYDLALRIGALADSSLVARGIAQVGMVTCCSEAYLRRHQAPRTPAGLASHDCLVHGHARQVEWRFGGGARAMTVTGRYRANNGKLLRDAAIQGLGITQLPTFIIGQALDDGTLVTVLDAYRPPPTAVHAVNPQHRQRSLLIHAFVDYLHKRLADAGAGTPKAGDAVISQAQATS